MDSEIFSNLFENNLFGTFGRLNLLPMLHNRLTLDTAADVDDIPGHATNEAPLLATLNAGGPSNQAGAVIAKIENIFESITDSVLNEKNQLVISLKARPRSRAQRDEAITKTSVRNITFPNKNPKEAWKFSKSSDPQYGTIANICQKLSYFEYWSFHMKLLSQALSLPKGYHCLTRHGILSLHIFHSSPSLVLNPVSFYVLLISSEQRHLLS